MTGKIICIECGEIIGQQEGIDKDTHGMCQKCLKEVKRAIQEKKKKQKKGIT